MPWATANNTQELSERAQMQIDEIERQQMTGKLVEGVWSEGRDDKSAAGTSTVLLCECCCCCCCYELVGCVSLY